MRNRNRTPNKNSGSVDLSQKSTPVSQEQDLYEGERLGRLLKSIQREIETAKLVNGHTLPEKFWYKQQFAIGVNEVTRLLERMSPSSDPGSSPELQAILVASDCHPKWLTKHLPPLASSRKVPIIFVKDQRKGSLRLGELVKVKTAIAIGVKAKGSAVNIIVDDILRSDKMIQDVEKEPLVPLNLTEK